MDSAFRSLPRATSNACARRLAAKRHGNDERAHYVEGALARSMIDSARKHSIDIDWPIAWIDPQCGDSWLEARHQYEPKRNAIRRSDQDGTFMRIEVKLRRGSATAIAVQSSLQSPWAERSWPPSSSRKPQLWHALRNSATSPRSALEWSTRSSAVTGPRIRTRAWRE